MKSRIGGLELTISRDTFELFPRLFKWKTEYDPCWLRYCACTTYYSLSFLWFEFEIFIRDE